LATPITILPTDALKFFLSAEEVRRALLGVNPRKAAGPGRIPGRVPSPSASNLPSFCRSRKKSAVSSLNDYRPVALQMQMEP